MMIPDDDQLGKLGLRPGLIERVRPHPSQLQISLWQSKLIDAAIAWGIIYCIMVFVAALSHGRTIALLVAVATAGTTYLSFIVQIGDTFPPVVVRATVGLSILLGLTAGLLLLV